MGWLGEVLDGDGQDGRTPFASCTTKDRIEEVLFAPPRDPPSVVRGDQGETVTSVCKLLSNAWARTLTNGTTNLIARTWRNGRRNSWDCGHSIVNVAARAADRARKIKTDERE